MQCSARWSILKSDYVTACDVVVVVVPLDVGVEL